MVKFSTKAAFQASPEARPIHEIVVSTAFHKAGAAALLHYQDHLTQSMPPTGVAGVDAKASAFDKLTGAREFFGVLLNLTEQPEAVKPKPSQNLNHTA